MTTIRNWLGVTIPMDRLSLIAVWFSAACTGAVLALAAVWP